MTSISNPDTKLHMCIKIWLHGQRGVASSYIIKSVWQELVGGDNRVD